MARRRPKEQTQLPDGPSAEAPQSAASPSAERTEKERVRDEIAEILAVPKARGAVPTLVTYSVGESVLRRHVVIDICGELLAEAWKVYHERLPADPPELFLADVYDITSTEIPRMYRNVSVVELKM